MLRPSFGTNIGRLQERDNGRKPRSGQRTPHRKSRDHATDKIRVIATIDAKELRSSAINDRRKLKPRKYDHCDQVETTVYIYGRTLPPR